MNSLYSGETDNVLESKPSRLKNLGTKIASFYKENRAGVFGYTGLAVGTLALFGVVDKLSNDQNEGIDRALDKAAIVSIPGAVDVDVDGTMWNYTPGSLHGATVDLDNGKGYSIQYTTEEDGGLSWFFPDHAKIVSFGTCPTIEDLSE